MVTRKRRRLHGQRLIIRLSPPFLLLATAALLICTYAVTRFLSARLVEVRLEEALQLASYIATELGDEILRDDGGTGGSVASRCKALATSFPVRIRIIRSGGVLLCDYGFGTDFRRSVSPEGSSNDLDGLGARTARMWTATDEVLSAVVAGANVPVLGRDGRVAAAVIVSLPVTGVESVVSSLRNRMLLVGVCVVLAVMLLSLLLLQRIVQPIFEIRRAARRFARGQLSHAIPPSEIPELAAVADSLNAMARQLDERIRTIVEQRNAIEAVFASMSEGVIAVDREERIIRINGSAARFLEIDVAVAKDRPLREVFRTHELITFISDVLREQRPLQRSITVHKQADTYLQLHGTVLEDAEGSAIGAVVVFSDVTELRRLATQQKDFVANVSHELRTPITSIKGFVETLLDDALDDRATAERFLRIVARHTDRLYTLIDELLGLARIEQGAEEGGIAKREVEIGEIVETVREVYDKIATAKGVRLDLTDVGRFRLEVNKPLVEQAVLNLIDNAVNASESGMTVRLRAFQRDDASVIEVADEGGGIPREHLPRLFERFYRVDRARSRPGGSGLGLSIVSRVAEAHGGSVVVESEPGSGSVFTLTLPRGREPGTPRLIPAARSAAENEPGPPLRD